ncbi:MAG: hypothetical protein M1818_005862 [Claussenomyces sp. TS43310]|nr:MAG: hypothetical protein M1818_005862 [Claussenomyces sp. TS43310]
MAKHRRATDDAEEQNDTYASDDGFVEDAPRSKKAKSTALSRKANTSLSDEKDDEPYWELASAKKRAAISDFKGKLYVDVRDYYEKDGVMNRTQKGIMLSVEAFTALLKVAPQIKAGLRAKGARFDDPESASGAEQGGTDEPPPQRKKVRARVQKSNIEATSDEEDDDD